jgi:putative addiction module component (TIGR02574 family)
MPKEPAELLRDALSLPAEARAALVDTLLESLDDVQVDDDAEAAWRQEIYRRLQEIDSGAVRLILWDDAQRRLWARIQR